MTHHQIMVSLYTIPFPTCINVLVAFSQPFRCQVSLSCEVTQIWISKVSEILVLLPAQLLGSSITPLNLGHGHIGILSGTFLSPTFFLLFFVGSGTPLPWCISQDDCEAPPCLYALWLQGVLLLSQPWVGSIYSHSWVWAGLSICFDK